MECFASEGAAGPFSPSVPKASENTAFQISLSGSPSLIMLV